MEADPTFVTALPASLDDSNAELSSEYTSDEFAAAVVEREKERSELIQYLLDLRSTTSEDGPLVSFPSNISDILDSFRQSLPHVAAKEEYEQEAQIEEGLAAIAKLDAVLASKGERKKDARPSVSRLSREHVSAILSATDTNRPSWMTLDDERRVDVLLSEPDDALSSAFNPSSHAAARIAMIDQQLQSLQTLDDSVSRNSSRFSDRTTHSQIEQKEEGDLMLDKIDAALVALHTTPRQVSADEIRALVQQLQAEQQDQLMG
eukprot:TRINITY_DN1806_c0_g1_i1.p2 TRINITY_DN1806_c0_g1~~TRINITY_DN1806_c0_g1_i1.p2  ORF type:complete len:262 (+),score=65.56 TRINITY_DN1806_c0_g1_i1:40-825(+)